MEKTFKENCVVYGRALKLTNSIKSCLSLKKRDLLWFQEKSKIPKCNSFEKTFYK